ncbi:hypothetical protein QTP70_024966, partial [Hemibagrus guttatus]
LSKGLTEEEAKSVEGIKGHLRERPAIFLQMEAFLPKKNGLYLSLVLGNVNVNLLSKQSKSAYKDEYETFKLCSTIILLLMGFVCQFLVTYRSFKLFLVEGGLGRSHVQGEFGRERAIRDEVCVEFRFLPLPRC